MRYVRMRFINRLEIVTSRGGDFFLFWGFYRAMVFQLLRKYSVSLRIWHIYNIYTQPPCM